MIIDFIFLTLKCECQAADRVSSAVSVKYNSLRPSPYVCVCVHKSWRACVCVCVCVCINFGECVCVYLPYACVCWQCKKRQSLNSILLYRNMKVNRYCELCLLCSHQSELWNWTLRWCSQSQIYCREHRHRVSSLSRNTQNIWDSWFWNIFKRHRTVK